MTALARKRIPLLLLTASTWAASAVAQPVNTPYDSNGNGTPDSVIVDGDYDGDGHAEPEDIQAAVRALQARLPGEAGSVIVRPNVYRELCRGPNDPLGYCAGDPHIRCDPASGNLMCSEGGLQGSAAQCVPLTCQGWNVRPYAGTGAPRPATTGLIDLGADDADLTLECEPGARIEGIWNKRRFDGSSPPPDAAGGFAGARLLGIRATQGVTIRGCDLDGGMPRGLGAYDPQSQDWPLVADGGTATSLIDADAAWLDHEWSSWWVMLRPGCEGAQEPYAGCSAPEEFVQIIDTVDATDTLSVAGFSDAPVAGDRYVILYHSGGLCTGDGSTPCGTDAGCQAAGGSCDRSVEDDPAHGNRQTVYLSGVENVRLENLRISGSAHAGFYAKNSRQIDLVDSELLENGGYYGHGLAGAWPSIYLFSGVPEFPCFEGDTDCRLVGVRVENSEIYRGGTGVNLRWAPEPEKNMYIEGLEVRGNHIHDLFLADGSTGRGIMCDGKAAICESNVVERAGQGIFMNGGIAASWPSESPEFGFSRNSWGITVRDNVIRDLWGVRDFFPSFGILSEHGYTEDLLFENNVLTRIGAGPGPPAFGYALSVNGPNRDVTVAGTSVTETSGAALQFSHSEGAPPPVRAWREWVDLEIDSEDLGVDPALHMGDPLGFDQPEAVERLQFVSGGRISLQDADDTGHRGGVGGEAEALYVRLLIFGDAESRLNLNGLHLYYETLIGSPSQIIDLATTCPDGVLDPGEFCDDGNAVWDDGCSPQCRLEQEVALYGRAEGGGFVELVVEGRTFSVATTTLQNSIDVLEQLAEAINADPELQQLAIGAVPLGNRLIVDGTIDRFTVADAGFQEPMPIPALGRVGRLGLALGLLALGGAWLACRKRAA